MFFVFTWVRDFTSYGPHKRRRDGESSRDPAVCVDNMDRNIIIVDALNRVTYKLQINLSDTGFVSGIMHPY